MNFSVVVIARNEAGNLPKMAESAKEYLDAGGEIHLFDTGSTDDTPKIARDLGFNVVEAKTSFLKTFTKKDLQKWKRKFGINGNPVKVPVQFFCFDDARNEAAKISNRDVIFYMDGCDYFINFDYKTINRLVSEGYESFMVVQRYGGMHGRINRFYNRHKGKWKGHVHEFVESLQDMKSKDLPEETMCIFHRYVEKDRTAKYMAGLISTHMASPEPRWHYYLGRELYFNKLYKDARSLLQKCYDRNHWPEERAAAMCLSAKAKKCEGGTPEEVQAYYQKAYDVGSNLREACFEVSEWHLQKQNWNELLKTAMRGVHIITTTPVTFFEEARFHDVSNLFAYLYLANWWAGTKDMSVYYWKKFVKTHNIDEENHPHWDFFRKYKRLPAVPYKITDMSQPDIDNSIFKCLTTIDDAKPLFPTEDQLFMSFLRRYAPPMADGIDVFAGEGFRTVDMSKVVYPGIVHSFESDRATFQKLNANAFLNSRTNVKAYNISIGYAERKIKVRHIEDGDEEDLQEVSLDSLKFDRVGTLHIRAENPAIILSGARDTIEKNEPFIMLTNISTSGPVNFADIEDVILSLGYQKLLLTNSIYYIPKRFVKTKRVAIVCPEQNTRWDDVDIRSNGFGEDKLAVVNLAEHLVQRGHLIDIWCAPMQKSHPKSNPRYLEYRHFREFFETSSYYNAVVWWKYPKEIIKRSASKNVLWMTNFISDKIVLNAVDAVVFLSEYHRGTVLTKIDDADRAAINKISHVIPTGFSMTPAQHSQRDNHRCVYFDNHACSLEIILEAWPIIRKKFPDATLHIYDSNARDLKSYQEEWQMKGKIFGMRSEDVIFQGALDQTQLYGELEKASFWMYPCSVDEPFCIQGVMAQHAGVIPIASDRPFLKQLAPMECIVENVTTAKFAEKCLKIMGSNLEHLEQLRQNAREKAKEFSYDLTTFAQKFDKVMFG